MNNNCDISVVVPTRDRPNELVNCLNSLSNQITFPDEIIVVDDGDLEVNIHKHAPDQVPLKITESQGEPSTSTARNTGARLASSSIILIIDDDATLGPGYISRLKKLYKKFEADGLAGIGGFDESLRSPSKLERIFNNVFLLGPEMWNINKLGFQSWNSTITSPCKSDWLSGNNASFKREVLLDHPFPHWSGGREALEDIAMGMQLKNQGYYCIIDPKLQVFHEESEDNETAFHFGYKRARNRVRIFQQYCNSSSALLFLWAMFGNVVKEFLAPISEGMWQRYWTTAAGMVIGTIAQLSIKT